MTRFAPLFAAGFLATAAAAGGVSALADVFTAAGARVLAEPAAEVLELVVSLIGGGIAAAIYGRDGSQQDFRASESQK